MVGGPRGAGAVSPPGPRGGIPLWHQQPLAPERGRVWPRGRGDAGKVPDPHLGRSISAKGAGCESNVHQVSFGLLKVGLIFFFVIALV